MAAALTVTALDSMKPGTSRREIPDGHTAGLFFILQPSGKASWAVRYRLKNTRVNRKLTLGPYPAISLKDARIRASKAMIVVADGGDPAADKQTKRAEATKAADDTVAAAVDRFADRYLKAKKLRTADETKRLLVREAVKAWPNRAMTSITKKDVHALLDAVVDRGSPITANRLLAALRRFFAWAAERQIVPTSPCQGVKPPSKETSRDRVLDEAELALAWKACDAIGNPFASLFRLLILTGQRRDEVGDMRWPEIDLDKKTWTIPKERVKNGTAHVVPLSAPAIAIIEALPKIKGDEQFVFTTSGVTAVSGYSKAKERLDAAIAKAMTEAKPAADNDTTMPAWRLHDFRRTFASGCAGLGIALPVIERALNHVSGSFSGVAGVYQRFDFMAERRAAMDAWARHVEMIVSDQTTSTGNVFALEPRRRA